MRRTETDNLSPSWRRLLWPLLLALGLGLMVSLPVLALTNLDDYINLSKRAQVQVKSAFPDIEASTKGSYKYVATVWSKGYDGQNTTKEFGYIVLKSAITGTGSSTTDGWENQVNVNDPDDTTWGKQPKLVFDPNDGAKVYITWVECQNETSECNTIMWATCTLTGTDSCAAPDDVVYENGHNLTTPDIAADDAGRLHVVWKDETDSRIEYARYDGSSWVSTPANVPGTSGNSYNPALAWSSGSGGRLHLAWYEYDAGDQTARRIKYLSENNLGTDSWDSGDSADWKAPNDYRFTGGGTEESHVKPSIDASGDYVYVAWDVYGYNAGNKFALAFDWSADSGANWQDPDSGGTGGPNCDVANPGDGCCVPNLDDYDWADTYASPLTSFTEEDNLRPSIAISGTAPALVWHYQGYPSGGENKAYMVAYREAITSSGAVSWTAQVDVDQNLDYDGTGVSENDSANPDLAIWPDGELHIAHMGLWGDELEEGSDWDVYYRGAVMLDNSTDGINDVYLPIILKRN